MQRARFAKSDDAAPRGTWRDRERDCERQRHKTLREIERYTDKADQRRLSPAAMNKLETPSV
jgi:hypothetical protein